jgi:predicted lipid-binding transport protein (Tim44 family)
VRPPETAEASPDRYAGFAQPGSPVVRGLDDISAADGNFDVKQFVAGARAAYEMIVTAYATGDRRSLKGLLEREVFDGFDAVIRQREARGDTVETRFVSIDASELIGAQLRGKMAQITLRFVSQLVSVTRNRNDNVIEGSADSVTTVTDIWTFAREVTSRDPNWKLVATEGGA